MNKIAAVVLILTATLLSLVNPASATRDPIASDVLCEAENETYPLYSVYVVLDRELANKLYVEDGAICNGIPTDVDLFGSFGEFKLIGFCGDARHESTCSDTKILTTQSSDEDYRLCGPTGTMYGTVCVTVPFESSSD